MLFRTWNDIFDGQGGSFASRQHDVYSFSNRNVINDIGWPQKIVWHGAHSNGERNQASYCDAWTAGQSKQLGLASSLLSHKLLAQEKFSCQNRFVVLCIEATSSASGSSSSSSSSRQKRYANHLADNSILTEDQYQSLLRQLN